MHGVPRGLRLSLFQGLLLQSVDFLENVIYFRFARLPNATSPDAEIGVEGRWELQDSRGEVLAGGTVIYPVARPSGMSFPVLDRVVGYRVDPPVSFSLEFAGGVHLVIFDSNDEFESFSIPQLNVYV